MLFLEYLRMDIIYESSIFIYSYLFWYKVYLQRNVQIFRASFNDIFWTSSVISLWCSIFFHVLICIFSFVQYLFKHFAHFQLDCLSFFYYWVVEVFFISWVLCQTFVLQILSSICGLVTHSFTSIFDKSFKL